MTRGVWLLENALLHAAMENARIGLVVIDSSGRIVVVNEQVATLLGTDQLDLLGQPFQLLLRPELSLAKFREVFQAGQPAIRTRGHINVNGQTQVLLFQASTHVHESGEQFRSVAVVDVMSFGISYDQAAAMRHHLNTMNTAALLLDARQPEWPIVQVNPTFERITGHTAREAIGRPGLFQIGDPAHSPEVATLHENVKQGRTAHAVLPTRLKDSSSVQADWHLTPMFDAQGARTHIAVVFRLMSDVAATPSLGSPSTQAINGGLA